MHPSNRANVDMALGGGGDEPDLSDEAALLKEEKKRRRREERNERKARFLKEQQAAAKHQQQQQAKLPADVSALFKSPFGNAFEDMERTIEQQALRTQMMLDQTDRLNESNLPA